MSRTPTPPATTAVARAFLAAALVGGIFALSACGGAPTAQQSATQAATTTTAAPAAARAVDCAKADGDVESLICKNPELVSLDQQLALEFQHALTEAGAGPGADRAALQSAQDAWKTTREDCWKADDVHQCVLDAYRTRLVELKIDDPDTVRPQTVTYRCPDPAKPLTARFYNQFDPPAAVLAWGADTAVVFAEQTGSGARYGRDGVDYWEHQGEVTVDFHGDKFVCRTP
ncbi:MliC family protein [soil metagenome]